MPRVAIGSLKGLKPGSAITKNVRIAADRLYDAFLRDPMPGKRFGLFDRAYAEFVKSTEREFEKMALKIFRRWPLPDAVEIADVIQDFHCEIIRIFAQYNPERATVAAFLVWNAFARAKKTTNKQRGAKQDKDPSMFAFVVSGLLKPNESGPEHFDDCIDRLALENDSTDLDTACESMLDSKKLLRRIFKRIPRFQAKIVRRVVLNGGNVRQTAFQMISALEELDEKLLEEAVERKTKKIIAALQAAAAVWQSIKKQEQDDGNEEEQREEADRIEEERRQAERREAAKRSIGEAIRSRRSEARFQSIGEEWASRRRNRTGAYRPFGGLLCA
jgi:ribosomal protein L12E/L44/L45/RPP1/RPP2